MTQFYLKHSQTGKEYDVLGIDKEKGEIRLKGQVSEFTEPYDPTRLKEYGYQLLQREG